MAVFKKILILFDGSAISKGAALKGLELAANQKADVIGLKVINFVGELITPSDTLWAKIEKDIQKKAESILAELESMAREKGVHVTSVIREGSAEIEIINCAKEINADLIVMGMGGRGGLGKYLGRTTDRILREASCPVMVVR